MRNMNNGLCLPGFFLPPSLSFNLSFPKDFFCSFSNICVLSFFGKMPQQNHSFLFSWVIDCFVWPATKAFLWLYRIRNIFRTTPTHGFPQRKKLEWLFQENYFIPPHSSKFGKPSPPLPLSKRNKFLCVGVIFPSFHFESCRFSSQWKQLYSTSVNLPTICWKKTSCKKSWLFIKKIANVFERFLKKNSVEFSWCENGRFSLDRCFAFLAVL